MVADHPSGRPQGGVSVAHPRSALRVAISRGPRTAAAVASRCACARSVRALALAVLSATYAMAPCHAQTGDRSADKPCGELVKIATTANTTTSYALARPAADAALKPPVAVILLPGGGGHVDLDASACPRALTGNFLIRSLPQWHALGFVTALVDARSDHPGDEGLASLRGQPQHANDLGKLIDDLRARTGAAIWVIGTSRGTISAANAASRLGGSAAPDGLVLTSTVTFGSTSRQRSWVSQTVYDFPLDAIRAPTLIVGHAEDSCFRTPARDMDRVAGRIGAARKQVVTVTGGPGAAAAAGDACGGRSAHGFLAQESEVIAGIARFIRGERY